ncbi:MAG: hypothetical protein JWN82_213 [Candidatus Saccharibacteria bacterium]|nr:hypothetical protein [Candidatus Saccharibacteria bacterium]
MQTFWLILATVVTVGSVIPYARDILKGSSRPNIVSWITWTLLTGIATAAAINAGEYTTAIFTGSAVLETAIIVVLGLRYGYVKYTRFDVVCQVSAIVGIVLWQLFDSPTAGVLASVTIDFIGALPTIRHSWKMPSEETWSTYALAGLGGIFAIFALTSYNWVSLTYAVYIVIINMLLSAIIIYKMRSSPQIF